VAERLAPLATLSSLPGHPDNGKAWAAMFDWIKEFVDQRREAPRQDDVVDAILHAEIDGRPITDEEVIGAIQLIILGGLETTSGALGMMVMRFARHPEIPEQLRREPDLLEEAVEELLRLDPPFIGIARTAIEDTEISGQPVRKGEKVLIYYAAANRDPAEFAEPDSFDPLRARKRHLAFGAGPHRCAGSNLARLNLRLALEAIVSRLRNIELDESGGPVQFHIAMNMAPLKVPIRFTPGPRDSA
jgi:cytochrome P450